MGSQSGQRDHQGVHRGNCQYTCGCKFFMLDKQNHDNVSCAYCGHLPICHVDLDKTPRIPDRIKFYHRGEPYYEFTNFAEGFEIIDPDYISLSKQDNAPLSWPTSEHYFQAHKFTNDLQIMETIRTSKDARDAFTYARKYINFQDKNWKERNVEVMEKALKLKFEQHLYLKNLLLSTGDSELVEHTVNDAFWGDGGDGMGQNMLGKLLMNLRAELRKEEKQEKKPDRKAWQSNNYC